MEDLNSYPNPQYYATYLELGGKRSQLAFFADLQKFFDLVLDAYVNGEGDRDTAYAAWVAHVGDVVEAGLYFEAVDSVTCLS